MDIPNPPGKLPDLPGRAKTSPPLDLPRQVMRRAAWVVVAGVLLTLLLGLARVRQDVDDELAGARPLAELSEKLSTLDRMDDAQARLVLQTWAADAMPRHLRVRVADAQGALVVSTGPQPALQGLTGWLARLGDGLYQPAPPFTVAWTLPRPDHSQWSVTLSAAPESEHLEALVSLWESVLWMAAVAVGLLLLMAWNSRRAFAPLQSLLAAIADLEAPAQGGGSQRMRSLPTMPIAELDTLAAALQHLDHALASAQAQRQQLARQLLSLQEDERTRLARELHDEFGQRLTALRVNATWLARRCADEPELLSVVQDMQSQCSQIQQDVRAVLTRLRPLQTTTEAGQVGWTRLADLTEALQQLVAGWSTGQTSGVQIQLLLTTEAGDWHTALHPYSIPADAALALYRISQEALTNVARHAQATQATLRLSAGWPQAGKTTQLRLDWSVTDNGIGLSETSAAFLRGNGLAGMQERLWALAGELHVSSGPNHTGCTLSTQLSLPCRQSLTDALLEPTP